MSVQQTLKDFAKPMARGRDNKDEVKPRKRAHCKIKAATEYSQTVINSITVKLPHGLVPYPSQRLMMVKLIQSLKTKSNALIESPTGSGKTMALLAACCAWLEDYKRQRSESKRECKQHGYTRNSDESISDRLNAANLDASSMSELEQSSYLESLNDINEFVPDNFDAFGNIENVENFDNSSFLPTAEECTCLPLIRIYYGTRTHKQIAQVVKEFARLPFGHNGRIRHTILASREQSCINPTARASHDITAACKQIISPDGGGCLYRNKLRSGLDKPGKLRQMLTRMKAGVWDIEDLTEQLRANEICPYFASTRHLTTDADLVFTPFNYLVDPIIRNSSDVHLKNSIVLLDEAHNVEDTCRDAVSFEFKEQEFNAGLESFDEKLRSLKMEGDVNVLHTAELTSALSDLEQSMVVLSRLARRFHQLFRKFGQEALQRLPRDDRFKNSYTFQYEYLMQSLKSNNHADNLYIPVDSPEFKEYMSHFMNIASKREGADENIEDVIRHYRPNSTAIVLVEKFLYFMSYFSKGDYARYYKCNITFKPSSDGYGSPFGASQGFRASQLHKKVTGRRDMAHRNEEGFIDGHIKKESKAPIKPGFDTVLNLWCMAPSVASLEAFENCHSVILASGTLCPTDTLKTELGMPFTVEMEGNQVIPDKQIFASVVSKSPSGRPFVCTYKNMEYLYPELMALIADVCTNVPKGVLVFVSSYRIMNALRDVLQTRNDLKQAIYKHKRVFFEPNSSRELQSVLDGYTDAINSTEENGINGALMMAVFRGKVSEGIDFTDDMARCVVCIGIPYPSYVDELVVQKKQYNDLQSKTSRVLSGDEWYTTQAYRALNQALGRCLRHRNDWGAILLVDERFLEKAKSSNPDSNKISRWVRQRLLRYNDHPSLINALTAFVTERMSDVSLQPKPEPIVLDDDDDFVKPEPKQSRTSMSGGPSVKKEEKDTEWQIKTTRKPPPTNQVFKF
uniref:Helicase ATP-binding domain-containing protein n=1 Tax=Panagrellus redivivus TaxID=6233 RepID=A0A7E4VYQ0_PANRE